MAKSEHVNGIKYASRMLDFHHIVDDDGYPIFAPSMYLFTLAKKGIKSKSIRAYSFDLASFFTALENTLSVTGRLGCDYHDVTDQQMVSYIDGLLKREKRLSDKTIERHIATLLGFYNFTYEYGLMSKRKSFTFSYGTEEVKTTIMLGHTTKLHSTYIDHFDFKNIVLANISTKNDFIRERDRLALMLGYYAGFRSAELVQKGNLNVDHLRKLLPKVEVRVPNAIRLKIQGKGNKTRETQLTVEGTTAVYDFLWGAAKNIKTNLMCGMSGLALKNESYGSELFRSCIDHYLSKENLDQESAEVWKARSYHVLRKCFATNSVGFCYRCGLDPRVFVTQWLGHSDPKTTEIYIFYDALLNQRLDILKAMNLEGETFAQTYRHKFKK